MRKLWPLIVITIIAGCFRFFNLSEMPISPNWDEVSHGYNAYSILKTGHDEWGKQFPLIFRAFGDYKLPLYIYLTIIPVAIFGLNTFAIRYISTLAGTLAIPGIYLLVNALWPDKKLTYKKVSINLGLISAFLLAISPWHFFISRPALEANLSLTLIIFGSYFLVKALKSSKNFIYAAVLFGLSLHTYNTARVFVPLLVILFLIIYRKKIKLDKFFFLSGLIAILFSGIVAFQIFTGEGTARYSKLQILTENTIYQIGENREKSKLPPFLAKVIHNRPVFFVQTVAKNYLGYFSPQFWYQSKGAQTQFAIPFKNLFTLPVTILAIMGLIYIILKIKESNNLFILGWLLLSPVAASLTADPPQALRPNPLIPAVTILSVMGLLFLSQKLKGFFKPLVFCVAIFSISLSFGIYVKDYFTEYSKEYSDSWQYGYQEAMEYVKNNSDKYDNVFITKAAGEPHIFYAFYTKLDPQLLVPGEGNIRFFQSEWYWTDKIGKVYFLNDWDIQSSNDANTFRLESGADIPAKNSLIITTLFRIPKNASIIKFINHPLGHTAFVIAEIK